MLNIFKSRRGRAVAAGSMQPAPSARNVVASAGTDVAEPATGYDPRDMRQHTALLEATYRHINSIRDDAALVVFHACCACEIAIVMRKHSQVDLFNLAFEKGSPPLTPSHPAMEVVELLELWVQEYFKERSATEEDACSRIDDDALAREHECTRWALFAAELS